MSLTGQWQFLNVLQLGNHRKLEKCHWPVNDSFTLLRPWGDGDLYRSVIEQSMTVCLWTSHLWPYVINRGQWHFGHKKILKKCHWLGLNYPFGFQIEASFIRPSSCHYCIKSLGSFLQIVAPDDRPFCLFLLQMVTLARLSFCLPYHIRNPICLFSYDKMSYQITVLFALFANCCKKQACLN